MSQEGEERGGARPPFKKIIELAVSLCPEEAVRRGTGQFKKIIRTNRSLYLEGGGEEGKANNGVGSVI